MRIGIDIDDTISNTHDILFSYAQKYTAEELKKEISEPKSEIMSGNGYCAQFHNWNEEEDKGFWRKYYKIIIQQVKPKKFARDVIKKLREDGNEIYLITARYNFEDIDVVKETEKWLKDNEIEYDAIIFNAKDKASILKENNVKILVDDAETNCRRVAQEGICTYIMDSMENHNCKIENVKRLYSWIHAEQEIAKKKIGGI